MTEPSRALIQPFPMPRTTSLIRAFDNLALAADGTQQQKRALGNPAQLPRPWDPGTIIDPQLRYETWLWLDDVVTWFNHEHVWNLGAGYIPACWPQHPHLVHEIAVLADLRRLATIALTSHALEEWHRYAVPTFLDRLRQRTHDGCDPDHTHWPGRTKHTRHLAARPAHLNAYGNDCEDTAELNDWQDPDDDLDPDDDEDEPDEAATDRPPPLRLIVPRFDPATGELL